MDGGSSPPVETKTGGAVPLFQAVVPPMHKTMSSRNLLLIHVNEHGFEPRQLLTYAVVILNCAASRIPEVDIIVSLIPEIFCRQDLPVAKMTRTSQHKPHKIN